MSVGQNSPEKIEFFADLESHLDSVTIDWETFGMNWIDARTSILMQKTKFAQAHLETLSEENRSAALPIGYMHLHSSSKLMENEAERLAAIRRHIKDIKKIGKIIESKFPKIQLAPINYSQFYQMALFLIKDPELNYGENTDVTDPQQVYDSISLVANVEEPVIKSIVSEENRKL